ncbi:TadE/TadG family type IV pilus assembly protein [Streptomyces sp. 6N223]|uniref:TadE/TadG family type IV pilus assembly protein n=1 Tax=Streptomyces sp. 6N223 TaxID=3457412 RepID=UPI003FD354A3
MRVRGRTGSSARGDRGLSTVEVVFIAPLIMLFILVLVSFGQTVSGRSAVYGAARDAARAGSLERSAGAAMAAAREAVTDQLDDVCVGGTVEVDGSGFALGGLFTVVVSCEVRGLDLMGIGLETRMEGTSSSPIDPYRRIE